MILNQRRADNVDKVHLITAMMAANEAEDLVPDGELYRLQPPEQGEFFVIAQLALKVIAGLHRQNEDDWDGVVWMELFEASGSGSLADRLVEFSIENDPTYEEIRPVINRWLELNGL